MDGEEREIATKLTFYKTGKIKGEQGKLLITDKRVAFTAKNFVVAGGVIGQIFGDRQAEKKGVLFDIPFEQITAVRHGKQGLNKRILEIDSGGETYTILDGWKDMSGPLRGAITAAGINVTDTGDGPMGEGWKVG